VSATLRRARRTHLRETPSWRNGAAQASAAPDGSPPVATEAYQVAPRCFSTYRRCPGSVVYILPIAPRWAGSGHWVAPPLCSNTLQGPDNCSARGASGVTGRSILPPGLRGLPKCCGAAVPASTPTGSLADPLGLPGQETWARQAKPGLLLGWPHVSAHLGWLNWTRFEGWISRGARDRVLPGVWTRRCRGRPPRHSISRNPEVRNPGTE